MRIEVEEGEHRLIVPPASGGESLVDLRMTEGALPVTDPGCGRAAWRCCPRWW